VGLGKTVEAGLVLKELLARQSISRTLVIVPPNLLNQWQTELRVKFNELFEIVDSSLLRSTRQLHPDKNPWLRFSRALTSSHFVRSEDVRAELVDAGWDLIIVDEAHHVRRKLEGGSAEPTLLYRTVEALKDSDSTFGVLLLTATPMQLHHFELFSLVELVEPGLYQDHEDFENELVATQDFKAAARTLQSWSDSSDVERRRAASVLNGQGINFNLNVAVGREDAIDKLLASTRLTQSIVRNRKRTVGGFTKRRARRLPVDLTPDEHQIHALVERYLRKGFAAAEQQKDRLFGFELVSYQRLMASSSRALRYALEKRRAGLKDEQEENTQLGDEDERSEGSRTLALATLQDELDAIEELIDRLANVPESKAQHLATLVRQILARDPSEKVLVFTQYYGTQDLITELLAKEFSLVQFRGTMSRWEKDEAVARFRESAQVMVSTEAGGEGRNFQFCHIIVNYDLHWNPMRIEQRIGRLDRYGQRRDVHIYNIVARGTIEDHLIDIFENRLHLFEAAVGALELILGEVEEDLKKALLKASGDIDQAAEMFIRDVDLRLRDAQRVEEKSADFLIEIGSFRKDLAERLTTDLRESRVRTDLELLVIKILSLFPTARMEAEGDQWHIVVPPALPTALGRQLDHEYQGTFAAPLAVENESLEFFAFGHPLVDACLEFASRYATQGLTGIRTLPSSAMAAPAVVMNFLVEFAGVRKRADILSIVLHFDGQRNLQAEMHLPFARPTTAPLSVPSTDELEILRSMAFGHLQTYAEKERPAVIEINAKRAADEVSRAERIHAYNQRRTQERRQLLIDRITRIELEGDADQKKILPALRGQIEATRRDEASLAEELRRKLADLNRLRTVRESFELISAALLVPA
jgi:ERCC4-related helicase